LKKVNNFDYIYTVNGGSVTVNVANAGQTVATYNFEEE
jgi:archaellum component FlaF (FlaF/FlaG flagellin family)